MPKLIFRGAHIRFVDLRYDEKSKMPYVKVNFTAAFSDVVREAMGWGEPPTGYGSSDLDGEFSATHFILTPNGRELKQSEIQINAKSIGSFSLERVKGDDGDSTHHELRFQLVTPDEDAAAKLQGYIAVIGRGEAQLRVNYEAQSELEMEAEAEAEEQPEAEATLIDAGERGGRRKRQAEAVVTQ